MIGSGDRVRVLTPMSVAGKNGRVLQPEYALDGSKTGYWLVRIDGTDMVFALLPEEMQRF